MWILSETVDILARSRSLAQQCQGSAVPMKKSTYKHTNKLRYAYLQYNYTQARTAINGQCYIGYSRFYSSPACGVISSAKESQRKVHKCQQNYRHLSPTKLGQGRPRLHKLCYSLDSAVEQCSDLACRTSTVLADNITAASKVGTPLRKGK